MQLNLVNREEYTTKLFTDVAITNPTTTCPLSGKNSGNECTTCVYCMRVPRHKSKGSK